MRITSVTTDTQKLFYLGRAKITGVQALAYEPAAQVSRQPHQAADGMCSKALSCEFVGEACRER